MRRHNGWGPGVPLLEQRNGTRLSVTGATAMTVDATELIARRQADILAVVSAEPPVPEEVLRLGRRCFNAGLRLEMTALAADLGVNRVTLYRWVGSRERLLVEVMWSLAERALALARSQVPPTAQDRSVRVVVGFLDLVLAHPGMQQLLATDIDLAMRVLTHRAAGFQPRLLRAVEELLREETAAGRLDVPMDGHELAYVVVRLVESYTYLNVLMGEPPEAARAEAALRVLLLRR